MDDRTRAGLRGPVCACRIDTTLYPGGRGGGTGGAELKRQSHWTLTHYHADGRIADHRHHNPNGSEWISTYDASGRLQEIETRDPDGSVSKTVYEYDQRGRLQRLVRVAAEGARTTLETYTYSNQGKSKTKYLRSGRAGSNVAYSIEGSDAAVSVPGATLMTTVYDRHRRPVEAFFEDSNNQVLSRVSLRYDRAGRLVEETQTSEIEQTLPPDMLARLNPAQIETVKASFGFGEGGQRWQRLHRYDGEGRRVETVSHMGTFDNERKTMAYNQHGDLIEEKTIRDTKHISIDDQGRMVEPAGPASPGESTTEVRISYQYDAHSNWTESVASSRHGPDKPFTISSVARRILTYQQPAESRKQRLAGGR